MIMCLIQTYIDSQSHLAGCVAHGRRDAAVACRGERSLAAALAASAAAELFRRLEPLRVASGACIGCRPWHAPMRGGKKK